MAAWTASGRTCKKYAAKAGINRRTPIDVIARTEQTYSAVTDLYASLPRVCI